MRTGGIVATALLLLMVGVAVGTGAGQLMQPAAAEAAQIDITLKAPPLENVVMQGTLANDAGISAYFKANKTINLTASSLTSKFRTIEATTANYLIGSVQVGSYDQSEDVKVYVSKDGWFLAYYPETAPTAKMVDIARYRTSRSLSGSKLELALAKVAGGTGTAVSGVSYYDFRNPAATRLMLIGEYFNDGNALFTFNLPVTFIYSEFSLIAQKRTSYSYEDIFLNSTDYDYDTGDHYWTIGDGVINIGTRNTLFNRYTYTGGIILSDAAAVLAITYTP